MVRYHYNTIIIIIIHSPSILMQKPIELDDEQRQMLSKIKEGTGICGHAVHKYNVMYDIILFELLYIGHVSKPSSFLRKIPGENCRSAAKLLAKGMRRHKS